MKNKNSRSNAPMDRTESEFEDEKIQVNLESHDHTLEEFKDNHTFEDEKNSSSKNGIHTFKEFEFQADRVRKLGLIFIYCKSEVAGRSGQEIGTALMPLQ